MAMSTSLPLGANQRVFDEPIDFLGNYKPVVGKEKTPHQTIWESGWGTGSGPFLRIGPFEHVRKFI